MAGTNFLMPGIVPAKKTTCNITGYFSSKIPYGPPCRHITPANHRKSQNKRANTLFSIDRHSPAVIRAYAIEGSSITNPTTFSEETFGYGPVGIAASIDLGLDLGISSCYNKIILLSEKTLGAKEILGEQRSEL